MSRLEEIEKEIKEKGAKLAEMCGGRSPKDCGHGVTKSSDMGLMQEIEAIEEEIDKLTEEARKLRQESKE